MATPRPESRIKRHPLAWFYVLAFALSWAGWAPQVAGSWGWALFQRPAFMPLLLLPAVGPMVAALLVARATDGPGAARKLLASLVHWRVGAAWYAVALAGPFVLLAGAAGLNALVGGAAPQVGLPGGALPGLASVLAISLVSNPWEEVGWRGFALPRLQGRLSAATATLIVGCLWGLWHLPLFLWRGNPMAARTYPVEFAGIVGISFVYSWLYNSARGGLLIVALFHVAVNVAGSLLGSPSATFSLSLAIVDCLAAVTLVAVFGGERLSVQASSDGKETAT